MTMNNLANFSPVNVDSIENRFGFHPATDETRPKHEDVRVEFIAMAHSLESICPNPSREFSLCLTALQEAAMWANASIACNLAPLEEK